MLVAYTRTQTVFINPRILEEYFELEENEKFEDFSSDDLSKFFAEIPISELVDLSEKYDIYHNVTKI